MTVKSNPALDRRAVVRLSAIGAAATAATVATATNAEAAAGQAVLQGRSNNAGTAGTTLVSNGTGITLTVKNTGPGAAAYFFGQNSNGFAGGTAAANRYGLSAANSGPAGAGAGLAASGTNNTGILANTRNPNRFAVEASLLSDESSDLGNYGGGVAADGGLRGIGVLGQSGWVGVLGATDGDGLGVLCSGNLLVDQGHPIVQTGDGNESYAVISPDGAVVTFTGTVVLNASGQADVTLASLVKRDVDLTRARCFATPNTVSMPNLFASVTAAGVVQIRGGVASHPVSYQVMANRKEWVRDGADARRRAARIAGDLRRS